MNTPKQSFRIPGTHLDPFLRYVCCARRDVFCDDVLDVLILWEGDTRDDALGACFVHLDLREILHHGCDAVPAALLLNLEQLPGLDSVREVQRALVRVGAQTTYSFTPQMVREEVLFDHTP
eukprot:9503889-Pyramimonas_sp.AAC.1